MYAGQQVLENRPAGVGMFPPLDLMSPPLELAPLPLESSPLDTVQPSPYWAPLEMVELGVCKFCVGFCGLISLFADKFALSLFSTTLFANPHRHNRVIHPAGRRDAFWSSSKQSYGLCQTSCFKLVYFTGLRPTAAWNIQGLRSSCGSFIKLLSC